MSEMVAKLDDLGRPAWIALMVVGFIVFWPVGLAVLAYLIWSGRMGCGRNSEGHDQRGSRWERKMERFQDKMSAWQRGGDARAYSGGFEPTGNRAFDEYREATLKRLEEEFGEFKSFLGRLREAKDKAEFEQFMADRRNRPTPGPASGPNDNPPSGSVPKV
jgi:Protein of unknown function (DUF2852)